MTIDEPPVPTSNGGTAGLAIPPRHVYLGTLVISALLLIVAGMTSVLPWPASILGLAALGSTRIEGAHWLALGGGGLFAVLVIVFSLTGARGAGLADSLVVTEESTPSQPVAAAGSLGVMIGEIPELWNGLGHPPAMTKGLVTETQAGQYRSFHYRFDRAASLAGAYDPSDGSVHALMGSVGLSHQAAPYFYLHLCFMLHPYSQDCIDAYLEEGLDGKQIADYSGQQHAAQWQLDGQVWKLEIAGDIQTIRVISEEAS